jgi:hypothetical protein
MDTLAHINIYTLFFLSVEQDLSTLVTVHNIIIYIKYIYIENNDNRHLYVFTTIIIKYLFHVKLCIYIYNGFSEFYIIDFTCETLCKLNRCSLNMDSCESYGDCSNFFIAVVNGSNFIYDKLDCVSWCNYWNILNSALVNL